MGWDNLVGLPLQERRHELATGKTMEKTLRK